MEHTLFIYDDSLFLFIHSFHSFGFSQQLRAIQMISFKVKKRSLLEDKIAIVLLYVYVTICVMQSEFFRMAFVYLQAAERAVV